MNGLPRDGSLELKLNVSTVLSSLAALAVIGLFKMGYELDKNMTRMLDKVEVVIGDVDDNDNRIRIIEQIIFKPMEFNKNDVTPHDMPG